MQTTVPSLSQRSTSVESIGGSIEAFVQRPVDPLGMVIVPRPRRPDGEELVSLTEANRWIAGLSDEQLLDYALWLDSHPLGNVVDTRACTQRLHMEIEPYDASHPTTLVFYARVIDQGRRAFMWHTGAAGENGLSVRKVVRDTLSSLRGFAAERAPEFGEIVG